MQTYSYTPVAPLSHFIDIIWFSQACKFDYANLTLPMLQQELIINFSSQFTVSRANQIEIEKQTGNQLRTNKPVPVLKLQKAHSVLVNNEYGWLSGLQTSPIQTSTAGKHFTVGVLFKPWGLQALTGINAMELQDSAVSLETVFGREAKELIGKIYEQPAPEAIFSVLETFLKDKLSRRTTPDILLKSIIRLQQETPEDGMIQRLARDLSLTPKSLIQAFKKYIGLTPGKFYHLLLLNKTLQHLTKHPPQSLTRSGYDLHFFDQAHFIHFFKTYTGFTPAAYIRQFKAGYVLPTSPNSIEIMDSHGVRTLIG